MSSFINRLLDASQANRSLLCIGLDPDPDMMAVPDVVEFNRTIIDATKDLVCAYKPNVAFYEALGIPGVEALVETVRYIHQTAAPALVIGDAKRGDIGSSARMYARACFEVWGFDAITVSPYLGEDSLQPFLDYAERGVFILCRTSNPGARDLQDLSVSAQGSENYLFERVAQLASGWNSGGNVGLVVGATYPEQLKTVRAICPDLPILIPGVGAQGGDLKAAVSSGVDGSGRRAIINSSRQIIYASRQKDDFGEAARREAMRLRNDIDDILKDEGKGW